MISHDTPPLSFRLPSLILGPDKNTLYNSPRSLEIHRFSDYKSLTTLSPCEGARLPSLHYFINRGNTISASCGQIPSQLELMGDTNFPRISEYPVKPSSFAIQKTLEAPIGQCKEINVQREESYKRKSSVKLCGFASCPKRGKAGGFCIAHGGGLRCAVDGCQKHAVTIGLCIGHGGGKRCRVEGCSNASRKFGVCWSHGGKRSCKHPGCTKGPKAGGLCWAHGKTDDDAA